MIKAGPTPAIHGVVRRCLVDLCQWIWEEYRLKVAKQTLIPMAFGIDSPGIPTRLTACFNGNGLFVEMCGSVAFICPARLCGMGLAAGLDGNPPTRSLIKMARSLCASNQTG